LSASNAVAATGTRAATQTPVAAEAEAPVYTTRDSMPDSDSHKPTTKETAALVPPESGTVDTIHIHPHKILTDLTSKLGWSTLPLNLPLLVSVLLKQSVGTIIVIVYSINSKL
jgi:hypothetical protein